MNLAWYDITGLVGVALIIYAYFLLQSGRIGNEEPRFSALNGAGAGLVLVSLFFDFNASAFVVELFWLVLSVMGFVRARRSSRGARAGGPRSEA